MFKRVLCLLLVAIFTVSVLSGCGASFNRGESSEAPSKDFEYSGADRTNSTVKSDSADVNVQFSEPAVGNSSANAITASGTAEKSVNNAILAKRKIIRNANVTIEVDNFDISYGKLKTFINGFGFVQESNITYGDSKEVKSGIIVIRIDKDKFETTLSSIKGLGKCIDENIKTDDVTDKFFDTEARLKVLKYEESRLLEYLNKITDPDTIFKYESRLADIREEIEGLTGTLNKWQDLVDLSTITINMSEKGPVKEKPADEKGYWTKLTSGFSGSFKGVIDFCGYIVLFLAQALPILVFLFFLAIIALITYRKVFKGGSGKSNRNKDKDSGIEG